MKNFIIYILLCGLVILFINNELHAQKTFTVNSTLDTPDANLTDGICDDGSVPGTNTCTLRAAILEANAPANPGHDIINFNIPGGGLQTILPGSFLPAAALPQLTDNAGVTIDGSTQPGASLGSNPPSTANLMIEIKGTAATAALPAPVHGLWVVSDNNVIQGLIINEFSGDGIRIEGTVDWTEYNLVYANFIGTNQAGTADLGNATSSTGLQWYAGVSIIVPPCDLIPVFAKDNIVRRNLISGNGAPISVNRGEGVSITNCPPGDNGFNTVEFNYIGTDKQGNSALGNDSDGVTIAESAHDNTIDNNLISGNGYSGVGINGLSDPERFTNKNKVRYNTIGLDITATKPIPNGFQGVSIGMYGPSIWGYAQNNSVISNTIAYNTGNGVLVAEHQKSNTNCDQNLISLNSIYSNGLLGIDLVQNPPGITGLVTGNDPGDGDTGPNQECNFPVILTDNVTGSNSTITGTVNFPGPGVGTPVEVFLSDKDPSGFGEGRTFLGSTTPNAAGNWTLVTTTILQNNDELTATSTDANKNTSEFSANYAVVIPLGVELLSFKAVQKGNEADLLWQTASEADNAGFNIEKSQDGISWKHIGWIAGKGTTSERQSYTFEDVLPFPGDNYYRLQQMDYSGKYEYSPVEYLFFETGEMDILNIFPNPSRGHFTINVYNPHQKAAKIKIYDEAGRLKEFRKFRQHEMPVFWEEAFDLPAKQIYFVVTQIGNKLQTKKLVLTE